MKKGLFPKRMILHFKTLWWGGVGGGEVAKVSLGGEGDEVSSPPLKKEEGEEGRVLQSFTFLLLYLNVPPPPPQSGFKWEEGRRGGRMGVSTSPPSFLFQFDSLPWAPRIVVAWRAWAREERGRRTWRHTECHKNSRYCSSGLLAQTRTLTT